MIKEKDNSLALSLCATAENFLSWKPAPVRWLEGGDEALVLHVRGLGGAFVLHASPARLSCVELKWSHSVARHAGQTVPQVVSPLEREGRTLFKWEDYHVAVYPFVAGVALDQNNPRLREAAARMLAKLHRALMDWPGGARPTGGNPLESVVLPPRLHDRALDEWWEATKAKGVVRSVIHGDFYERNLLCSADAITGVIDWHDAALAPLALELAGAAFAFCQDAGHGLNFSRVDSFVGIYRAAGGPVPSGEIASLLEFMRLWIQRDVALNLASGSEAGDPYIQQQIKAFEQIAQHRILDGHSHKS